MDLARETPASFYLSSGRFSFLCCMFGLTWVVLITFAYNPADQVDVSAIVPVIASQPIANSIVTFFTTRTCTHTGISTSTVCGVVIMFVPIYFMLCAGFAPFIHVTAGLLIFSARRTENFIPMIVATALTVVGVSLVADPGIYVSPGGYHMFVGGDNVFWGAALSVVSGACLAAGGVVLEMEPLSKSVNPLLLITMGNGIIGLIAMNVRLLVVVSERGYGSLFLLNFYQTGAIFFYGGIMFLNQLMLVTFVQLKRLWIAVAIMGIGTLVLPVSQTIAGRSDISPDMTLNQKIGVAILLLEIPLLIFCIKTDPHLHKRYNKLTWECHECHEDDETRTIASGTEATIIDEDDATPLQFELSSGASAV